jgi:hypothetical protein
MSGRPELLIWSCGASLSPSYDAALGLGHPETAELHERLGEILTLLGDYAGAIGHLEAAAATTIGTTTTAAAAPNEQTATIERPRPRT